MAHPTAQRVYDFYPLEDRILLSGEGLDGVDLAADASGELSAALIAELASDGSPAPDSAVAAALLAPAAEVTQETGDVAAIPAWDPALPLQVVFVDAGVADADVLLDGLRSERSRDTQWLVLQLSADRDGIDQISEYLDQLSGVDAIHILSHGDDQSIQLGSTRLDLAALTSRSGQVAWWGSALDADADLLIYGCDLASSADGRTLVDSIAALTHADVAASDDATGHHSLGGDWELEYATGQIETSLFVTAAAQHQWIHVLSTVTFQQGDANGYNQTLDTELNSANPTVDNGNNGSISIDLDNGSGESQGLIRFDGIIGSDFGDIPRGVQITSASLTVQVTGDSIGTISLYRMLNPWTESSNWNTFAGLTVGGELAATPDAQITGVMGTQTFTGLAATVQRWVDGYNNYGWGILINSTDGWDMSSSEGVTAPRLSVTYIDPGSQASSIHTLTVDTANDVLDGNTTSIDALLANRGADGKISLREAIWATNNTTNIDGSTPDVINFAVGALGSQQTIVLAEALPMLTDPVILDALTQGGGGYDGVPLIQIDGSSTANTATAGITVWTSDSTVRGFLITGSDDEGIEIAGSSEHGAANNNLIEKNWVGINFTGTQAANVDRGILIVTNAAGNVVRDNVVAGNGGVGIEIRGAGVDGNIVEGNYVGILQDGATVVANASHGVRVAESASNTRIGSNNDGNNDLAERNLIAGNAGCGVLIDVASGTWIDGNRIGTDATGTLDRGNIGDGIRIAGAATNTVIGSAGLGNLISGNNGHGIHLINGSNITIVANTIGANAARSSGVRNELSGINLASAQATSNIIIGGLAGDQENFIAYNYERGILTSGAGSGDRIFGNTLTQNGYSAIVSMRTGGMQIIGNTIHNNSTRTNFDEVAIGANHTLYHNTIHGSKDDGISVEGAGAVIQNNIITGSAGYGIRIAGGTITTESHNLITDAVTGPANAAGRTLGFTPHASDINADPLYTNAAAGDFTLRSNSPARNAGIDLGVNQPDVNDSAAGKYNDAAPDMGAHETTAIPVMALPGGALNYTENDPATVIDSGATLADTDSTNLSGGVLTVDFTAGGTANDLLTILAGGNITISGSNVQVSGITVGTFAGGSAGTALTINWNANATPARAEEVVRRIAYSNSSDTPNTTPRTVRMIASDGDGGTSVAVTKTINVTAVNDAPVIATNTGMTVAEGSLGTTIASAMLNEGDVDDSGSGLTYTVTAVTSNGTLRLAGFGPLGLNDTFTQADIDGGNLNYDHDGSETTSDSFSFSLADGGENGAAAATGSFNITVTPVNDNAPIITSDGGGATAIINVLENDLYATTVIAGDADLPAQTLTYTITGGSDAARFAINASTGVLSFVIAPNYEAPADSNSDNIYNVTVQASDGTLTDIQSLSIQVGNVADNGQFLDLFSSAAYNNSDGTQAWTSSWVDSQDGSAAIGSIKIIGQELRINADSVGINLYRSVNLSSAASATLDLSFRNAFSGSRAVEMQVSSNGGGTYTTLAVFDAATNTGAGTMGVDISAYATANTRIRFIVSAASVGGAEAYVQFDDIQVSYVPNTAPIITSNGGAASASINVAENSTAVTTVTASDGDIPSQTLTYAIIGGTDAARFAINSSSGALAFVSPPNAESPSDAGNNNVYDVVVQVSDGIATDTQSIAVTVTDVDEFNVGPISDNNGAANSVDENAANSTVVGITALASDADATNNAITYTLDDTAGGRFAINSSTGVVTVADGTLLDCESAANHSITVRATSSDGSFSTSAMTINVNDIDEFNVGPISDTNGAANGVDENAANGTAVGITALASDADATNNTITYTLDDTAGGRFAIDSISGVVTVADGTLLDRESTATHSITVRATSSDGSFSTSAMTINVNDVDEFNVGPISDTNGTANSIDENAANGTVVGITALASDADATTNAITYTLDDTAGGRFAINSTTGVVTVADGTLLDRESAASHNITVRATSSDGSFSTSAMTINVNDVDDFNVGPISDNNGAANSVDENAANGTAVGITALASDADATNNAITYTLDDTAGGRFAINSTTGVVTVADGTQLDRESAASHNITVRATSSDGSFSTQAMTININDVDEFNVGTISDTDGATNSVDENAANGTTVGITALASDADATNNTITYSLSDDDGGRFTINNSTGVVSVASAIDRETDGATRSVTVRATSPDGSFTDQSFTININDVNETSTAAINDVDASPDSVIENAAGGTTTGITAFAIDTDATDTMTYALDDDDDGRFTIDANTGVVTITAPLDREVDGGSRNITVRATSSDGSFQIQTYTIAVVDQDEFDVIAISDTNPSVNEVSENAAVGSVVGITTAASDADATNNTITYTLSDDDGGRFAIDSNTGVVTVAGSIDRESDGAARNINVRATGSDGSFSEQIYAISVIDVDEFDVGSASDSDPASNQVDENTAIGTNVGVTAAATDADATNNTVTFTLVNDDGGRFTIDVSTGVVTTAAVLDYESEGPLRSISVRSTGSDGSSSTQAFTIAIGDVNEAPVASGDSYTVISGTTLVVAAPGLTANDSDVDGDSLSAVLVSGPSNGTLTLNPSGSLTYTPSGGFFGLDSFFYQVTDGGLQSSVVEVTVDVQAASPGGTGGGASAPPPPTPEPSPASESDADSEDDADTAEPSDDTVVVLPGGSGPAASANSAGGDLVAIRTPSAAGDSSPVAATISLTQDAMSDPTYHAMNSSQAGIVLASAENSAQTEMMQRLLQLDLEQAIIWQQWDQSNQEESSPVVHFVGSASAAAGLFSVGYVFWALRGGAFVAAVASSMPTWRVVDPTAMLSAYHATQGSTLDRGESFLTK